MITKLTVRNFKRFDNVEIPLGNPVVLIGPNNSGKTSALQALALWEVGLRRWREKRAGRGGTPEKRPGVTINRRDLLAVPVPIANLLWRDLHVRSGSRIEGKTITTNVLIEIIVEGISNDKSWTCGLEFDYANEESFYCRPLRQDDGTRMGIPDEAAHVRVAFLPPMSGLAAQETSLEPGAINVRIGEGRTAEVLRNLCYQIIKPTNSSPDAPPEAERRARWNKLTQQIQALFGVLLKEPEYISERGEIIMSYRERTGVELDLSAAGRGLQQTLLLLAYMYANPGTLLLLDEPDAHLEILRQRQIYQLLTEVALEQGNQIIVATHSEVVLNEAAGRDVVIAFVGKPHRINDRGSQVLKALTSLGFDQYVQAEDTGWVLYLEGSTDLAVLQSFARTLGHDASEALERPFVCYVANQPSKAREHFYGLQEAYPRLRGIAIFDHLPDIALQAKEFYTEMMWQRREIENYFADPQVLLEFARTGQPHDLFGLAEANRRVTIMQECIRKIVPPIALEDRTDPWWRTTKMSDEFFNRVFAMFFKETGIYHTMPKAEYHQLARLMPADLIDDEVKQKLDAIVAVARTARSDHSG